MGIHFQRNRFVGAAAQETCNVLGGEFFQSQLFVLDDVDEFTEQEPVRELCLPKTSSGPLRLPQGPCNMLQSLFASC